MLDSNILKVYFPKVYFQKVCFVKFIFLKCILQMHFCNPVPQRQCILCTRKHFHPLCMPRPLLGVQYIVHGQVSTFCMTIAVHALHCIFHVQCVPTFHPPVHAAWCIRTVFSPDDGSFIPNAGRPLCTH